VARFATQTLLQNFKDSIARISFAQNHKAKRVLRIKRKERYRSRKEVEQGQNSTPNQWSLDSRRKLDASGFPFSFDFFYSGTSMLASSS
jgi:hypothetical protein